MIYLDHGLAPELDFGSEFLLDVLTLPNLLQLLLLGLDLDFDPNVLLALLFVALLVVLLVVDYCL